jgi:hypothetical protein
MTYTRPTKAEGLARVTALVERYRALAPELTRTGSTFTETDARVAYIDPLLEALGWDVRNIGGLPQRLVEVVMERTGSDLDGAWGRPDYRLRIDGTDSMPVEAKKPSVPISTDASSARQARSYGWSLSLPAALLTNFDELIVFDARVEPSESDNADVAVIPDGKFGYEDYITRFDDLWRLASYESLATDGLKGVYDYTRPPRGESPFDARFLGEFRKWRQVVAQAVADGNPTLVASEVGRRTQSVLNALLFLRVCEDREIGRYQHLLESATSRRIVASFREADRAFNAGLFTVLRETSVDDVALADVVREMYWPRTQFAFGVLDPAILAGVYEQYLAERVVLDESRRVQLELKPELADAGGIVATPDYIVHEIGAATLGPLLANGVADDLTVLDPAVGSGVFLLDAFERIIETAEDGRERLTLAERGDLARRHLFGIDIDGAAVEVAKLSLLLAVLGNEYVDVAAARNVLPDISRNIVTGNSVVRENFDVLVPEAARVTFRRAQVAPLDVRRSFGSSYPRGGFTAIVGNPPYVRIQELNRHLPDHLAYLQHPASRYDSPQANNFDLYMVFIERAFELLAADGRLGMIVPSRFTNHLSASGVRLKLGARLEHMTHFGEEQVFPGRTTYTAIIVAAASSDEPVVVNMVGDLACWRASRQSTPITIERDQLGAGTWPFATADQTALFGQLNEHKVARLGDPGWVDIFVGVQTSADEWLLIRPLSLDDADVVEFIDTTGVTSRIERSLLRPAVKDRSIAFYDGQPVPDRYAIFPYDIDEETGKATLISAEDMRNAYPLAHAYFERHREKLQNGRNVTPDPGDAYWAYGRSQSLSKLRGPKLIARVMSLIPRYALDAEDFVAPGGGDGGPYGFLRPTAECPYSIDVIQAILSHPAVDLMVAVTGKKFRGSYAVHRKQFLIDIPVPRLTIEHQQSIESRVDELRDLAVQLRSEEDVAMRRSISDRRALLAREVDEILSSAYRLDPELVARVLGAE